MNENYYLGFKFFIKDDGTLEENEPLGLYEHIPVSLMEFNAKLGRIATFRQYDKANSPLLAKLVQLYHDVSYPYPKEWMYEHNAKVKEVMEKARQKAFPNKPVDPLLGFMLFGSIKGESC
jgi:hypothetical protein